MAAGEAAVVSLSVEGLSPGGARYLPKKDHRVCTDLHPLAKGLKASASVETGVVIRIFNNERVY